MCFTDFPIGLRTCTVSSFPDAFPSTDVATHGLRSFARSRNVTLAVGVPSDRSLSRFTLPLCQLCCHLDASAASVREDIVLRRSARNLEFFGPKAKQTPSSTPPRSLMHSRVYNGGLDNSFRLRPWDSGLCVASQSSRSCMLSGRS